MVLGAVLILSRRNLLRFVQRVLKLRKINKDFNDCHEQENRRGEVSRDVSYVRG